MGYSSPALTCVKASRRKSCASVFVLLVNGGRTSSRQQPGQAATEEAIIELAAQPEVVALVNVVSTLTATFRRRKSRNAFCCPATHCRRFKHAGIYALCDAHERFMTLLEPWLDKLPGRFFIALPAHAKRCRRAWRVDLYRHYRLGLR